MMSLSSILINQEFEFLRLFKGQNIAIIINTKQRILDFLLMKIGDKINKNGINVSGASLKGTINPLKDKNADKGVKLFYSTANCLK